MNHRRLDTDEYALSHLHTTSLLIDNDLMNLLFELYLTLLTNTALDSGKQTNIINENMSLYDFKKILCCMSVSQVLLIKTYSES